MKSLTTFQGSTSSSSIEVSVKMLQDGQLQQSGSGVDDPTATTADVARKR